MMVKKHLHVKKDDQVVILSGEEKGKRGKILWADPENGQVVVEGANYIWKHLRRSQQNPQGGRLQKEAAFDAGKVMLVCSACGEPTRVKSVERSEKRGERTVKFRFRQCKKCGAPASAKDKEYAEKK